MVSITLPDGSKREFENAPSVLDIAKNISVSLAKAALAGRVDGRLVDLSHVGDKDAEVAIVTGRDPEGLDGPGRQGTLPVGAGDDRAGH